MRGIAVISLLSLFLIPQQIQSAEAAGPATGTSVAWTNDTYFDMYTSQSGVMTSDKADTNNLIWQMYYSNAPLSIPADSALRVGLNTYANGTNSWTWRIAISTVNDTIGSFGTDTQFASGSYSYSAGGFYQSAVTTAVTIPANRYFLIGVTGGPYYRSFKALGANRSAQIGGATYVTAINTMYYSTHGTGPTSGIPIELGGSTVGFTTYSGFVPVMSIRFKATGAPASPALSTPGIPVVASISDTSAIFSETMTVANAQSYIANLYSSNGSTLLESRTVSNSQVISGFTWTGLSAFTSYKIGFTAVGDQSNFGNSNVSTLQSFTTTQTQTSVSFTLNPPVPSFNSLLTATASVSGATSGKITYYENGKRIPSCISKAVTSSYAICSWKLPKRGILTISAVFTPSSSSALSSSTEKLITVLNRTTPR